jgi:alkylation response protein AidB-like acyl-CoA dehydrogenase
MAKDNELRLRVDAVRVPASSVVGRLTDAAPFETLIDLQAVILASLMHGAARRMLEFAVAFVKGREAFEQPIAAFQAMQHLAADMLNAVDGTELLCREALWRMANGLPARMEASQAKAFASERCVMVCRSAQQMHGGIGFMEEFDLALWYRRVVSWSLRGGTVFEHRARVAAALLSQRQPVRLGMTMRVPESVDRETEGVKS